MFPLRSSRNHFSSFKLIFIAFIIISQFNFSFALAAGNLQRVLKAAERGDPVAQYTAGRHYEFGIETSKNIEQAAHWYLKSATQGYAKAQTSIGFFYQTGSAVNQNLPKSIEYFEKAANQGDVGGQFMLGVAYINGIGVPKNARNAAEWIYKAGRSGHQQSQLMLGTMLLYGLGVKKNEFAARKWLVKAAEGDQKSISEKAKKIKTQLDDKLLDSTAFGRGTLEALALVGFGLLILAVATGGHNDGNSEPEETSSQSSSPNALCAYYIATGDWDHASALGCL